MPSPFPPRAIAAACALLLAACGSSTTTTTAPAPVRNVFLDSAVEGLDYVAGSAARASTNAQGEFACIIGDRVSFSVGGVALGSASCAGSVTPLTLAGVADVKDPTVVNRLLALQLLDEDNDPANGIRISADTRAALADSRLDFGAAAAPFNTALKAVLARAGAGYGARSVDEERRLLVREHFEDTLASKMNAVLHESVTQGQVSATITRYQVQAPVTAYVPYEGANPKVKEEFPNGFLPSYGSALAFKGVAANGDLEFYGLTDRGPNGDGPNVTPAGGGALMGSKIFPAPSFAPSIGIITVGKNGAQLGAITTLKLAAGANASGLPLPPGSVGNSAEVPVFDAMQFDASSKAIYKAGGLDSEALAFDAKRKLLWIADEYGPFLLKADPATGIIAAKYGPGTGLPAIFAKRRPNRGMEGMALDAASDKIHGFLQSPLSDGSAPYSVSGKSEAVERYARFTRWVEFDPVTGASTRMFAYPLNGADYLDGRTGNAKLGEMVALGNGKFIVIEQGAAPDGKVFNKLMLVEIGDATDIAGAAFNASTSDLEKSSMSGMPVNGASWSGVTALRKRVLFDLNAAGWLAEKAEGLTLVDASTLALANDNDFGMKTRIFTPAGTAVADADVTKCNVDAGGIIVTSSAAGCNAANSIRVARGDDKERPSRLWLIKFDKALGSY